MNDFEMTEQVHGLGDVDYPDHAGSVKQLTNNQSRSGILMGSMPE
jgi:hypothetical protein